MKNKTSRLLMFLAVLSLGVIAGVIASGLINSRKPQSSSTQENSNVLGTENDGNPLPTASSVIETFVQNTVQNTKDTLTEKAIEVEKRVQTTLEKEVSSLTQSQVDHLKWQICTNWGVTSASPSPLPSP